MKQAYLEHTNITSSDPDATASILCRLFDWKVRWSGPSMDNGYTVHVGTDTLYLAIYSNPKTKKSLNNDFNAINDLNHIGIVVQDLKATETNVIAAGFTPHSHQDYENKGVSCGPSSNFYFHIIDDLEIEVISYHEQAGV